MMSGQVAAPNDMKADNEELGKVRSC
jgi:hypothetical protein